MTTPTMPPTAEPRATEVRPRRVDLALARAHLRLGSLALARTELETLAGLGALDAGGLVDLAEVRWRTGDLPGAGEAAQAALDSTADEPVALIIAAEAAAADGRPNEARRLAGLAMARVPTEIDRLFAGMPRSAVWPPDAAEPPPKAATLFNRDQDAVTTTTRTRTVEPHGGAVGPIAGTSHPAHGGAERAEAEAEAQAEASLAAASALTLGLWGGDAGDDPATPGLPDPDEALQAGRAALVAGSLDEAAFRLGLALRLAPALAPAVLEITDGVRSIPLIVVRGDAFRLVGHEAEARHAYALAAQGGPSERRRRARSGAKGDAEATGGLIEASGVSPDGPPQPDPTAEAVAPTESPDESPADAGPVSEAATPHPADAPGSPRDGAAG
jgi:hypothetical protein